MKSIEKIVKEIAKNRAKILDDFCKAYLSCHDNILARYPDIIDTLELVEQRKDNETIWFFRIKE